LGRVLEADLLTFGWGSHYCLGRHLGELEASLCLQQFFEQVRGYRIDLSRCTRVHTSTVHGFSSLPLMAIDLAE
jgi:cytochrome P450